MIATGLAQLPSGRWVIAAVASAGTVDLGFAQVSNASSFVTVVPPP